MRSAGMRMSIAFVIAGVGIQGDGWVADTTPPTIVAQATRDSGGDGHIDGVVLTFSALLAVIMMLTKLLAALAGAGGAMALAAISGTFDVDAISLSLARLVPDGLDAKTAVYAILVAVIANSLTKIALAWTTGGRLLGKLFAGGVAAALVAGGIGLWVTTLV